MYKYTLRLLLSAKLLDHLFFLHLHIFLNKTCTFLLIALSYNIKIRIKLNPSIYQCAINQVYIFNNKFENLFPLLLSKCWQIHNTPQLISFRIKTVKNRPWHHEFNCWWMKTEDRINCLLIISNDRISSDGACTSHTSPWSQPFPK